MKWLLAIMWGIICGFTIDNAVVVIALAGIGGFSISLIWNKFEESK